MLGGCTGCAYSEADRSVPLLAGQRWEQLPRGIEDHSAVTRHTMAVEAEPAHLTIDAIWRRVVEQLAALARYFDFGLFFETPLKWRDSAARIAGQAEPRMACSDLSMLHASASDNSSS